MIGLFKTVITMSAAGSILTLILIIIKEITERIFSARWHYNTKKIVMLFFIIPVITIFNSNPVSSIINKNNNAMGIYNISNEESSMINAEYSFNAEEQIPDESYNSEDYSGVSIKENIKNPKVISIDFINNIVALWILGMAVLALWYVYCYLKFIKEMRSNCKPILKDSKLYESIELCKSKIKVKRKFNSYIKEDLSSPVVIGFFKNTLLVPEELIEYENIEVILMHELTHIKRKDLTVKLIITLLSIVHWFNPLIYVLRNEIDVYCELSCDELITMYMSHKERKKYGESILKVAENLISFKKFSTTFSGNKKYIKRRLIMVLNSKKQKKLVEAVSVGIIAVVLVGGGCLAKKLSNEAGKNILFASHGNSVTDDKANEESPKEEINEVNVEELAAVSNDANKNDNTDAEVKNQGDVEVKPEVQNTNTKDVHAENTANTVKVNDKDSNKPNKGASENTYVNNKYGFSIQFPEKWNGKYKVVDCDDGAYVYVADKYLNGANGMIFFVKLLNEEDGGEFVDTIEGINKVQKINGRTFSVGCPTAVTMAEDNPSFELYKTMHYECSEVLKTLKAV